MFASCLQLLLPSNLLQELQHEQAGAPQHQLPRALERCKKGNPIFSDSLGMNQVPFIRGGTCTIIPDCKRRLPAILL